MFSTYFTFLKDFEGKLSKDPNDTSAAKCVEPGQYHTNKGVTYCTYKANAASFGLDPSYPAFLKLDDNGLKKFIKLFMQQSNADKFDFPFSYMIQEAAWGSGFTRPIKHIQQSLNDQGYKLAVDGVAGSKTLAAYKSSDKQKLYDDFFKHRYAFLKSLGNWPIYKNGWTRRIEDFKILFGRPTETKNALLLPIIVVIGLFLIFK